MVMPDESQERAGTESMGSREQAMPTPGARDVTPAARDSFLTMLAEREQKGIATYGRTLQAFNGRDAHLDAMEEAIDLWQYVTQARIERETLARLSEMRRAVLHGHLVTPCRSVKYRLDTMAMMCGYCRTYWEVGDGEAERHNPACIVAAPASAFLLATLSGDQLP